MGSGFLGANPVLGHPAVVATAERLGVTPGQVALAGVLDQGGNILLVPGTSSVAHLEENLAAGRVALDDDAWATLGELTV